MAYVYKGAGVVAEPTSALARSGDFGRQRDTYILASRYKNRDCIRLWNDFAAEQPAMARLVVKDVEGDRQASAAASDELDRRLVLAEKMVTKTRKAKKSKAEKSARPESVRDALRAADLALRLAERESCDPLLREWARMAARGE